MKITTQLLFCVFARLDRLAAIIVSQFFEYFRLTRPEKRKLDPMLIEAMRAGYDLWVRGMAGWLHQDTYSVQENVLPRHEVNWEAKQCTCTVFQKYRKVR